MIHASLCSHSFINSASLWTWTSEMVKRSQNFLQRWSRFRQNHRIYRDVRKTTNCFSLVLKSSYQIKCLVGCNEDTHFNKTVWCSLIQLNLDFFNSTVMCGASCGRIVAFIYCHTMGAQCFYTIRINVLFSLLVEMRWDCGDGRYETLNINIYVK